MWEALLVGTVKTRLTVLQAGLLVTLIAASVAPARAATPFVRPAEIEPDVRFWTRVYTEVTTNGGFVHDARHLGVVYEVITFPQALSPSERSRRVERVKDKYEAALRRLARDAPSTDPELDQRVRALWPENTSARAFQEAAENVRFQLGQADRFREGLIRAGAYEAHIAETFANRGLPAELAALPHVESSFNPDAYSHAGAAGLWQFMRSTGRRYMRIDSVIDERMDPYRSTEAAAQLLEFNYNLLGTWPLALTAYNHGASGMRRAKEKQRTDDIVTIIRKHKSRTFGFASRNYYVAFLAALDVDRDAEKYFGPLARHVEVKAHAVAVPAYVPVAALERTFSIERQVLRSLNPALTHAVWEGDRYVPKGFMLRLPEATVSASDPVTRFAALDASERFEGQKADKIYKVRSGDTLSGIATAHNTTVATLMRLNGMSRANQLRRGQILHLPGSEPRPVAVAAVAQPKAPEPPPVQTAAVYVVRPGDSLSEISRRVNVSESELLRLNQLTDRNFIYEGQELRVAANAATVAQLPAGTVTISEVEPQSYIIVDAEAQPEERKVNEREIAQAQAAEPVSAAQAEALGPTLVTGAQTVAMAADPSDYTIAEDSTIEVQAAETLGHYADWLGLRASQLRDLNNMRFGTPVVIGRRFKLDLSQTSGEVFEQRRRDYHQKLQEEFFAANRIVGTEVHVVRRGESLWTIAQKYQNVPIWLLRQYNPDVDFGDVRPRTELVMPRIESAATPQSASSARAT
jgi:membrane-bound lytic murein transglycosylase D